MQFTQKIQHFVETPSMIKPYHLDPQIAEIGFELTIEYTECTLAAVLVIDVMHLQGPASKLIFKILSDDVGDIHYSRTTLFSNPKYAPEHVYQACDQAYQHATLSDLILNFRVRIADEFVDKMFDNVTVFPYHDNGPLPTIEYGPEYRKSLQTMAIATIQQLTNCMPSYQDAYKLHERFNRQA